jgi:RNA polymerase sigma-70 factor (ECF subfamily)
VTDAACDALVHRYLVAGDEAALEQFIERTKPRLLAVARRIGSPQDAEDSVQSAYLSLLRRRGEDLGAPALPWLVTAVVRIAYRRKAVQKKQEDIARRLALPRETPLPLDAALSDERRQAIRDLVARLPDRYRDALALRHLEGLSVAEIATLLEVPEATVRTRIHRATRLIESRFPRALLFGLLLPWWITDRTPLVAGGMLVSKKSAAIVAVVLLALAGATWTLWPRDRAAPAPSAAIDGDATGVAVASVSSSPPAPRLEAAPGAMAPAASPGTSRAPFSGRVLDGSGRAVVGARVEGRGTHEKYETSEYFSPRPPPMPPRAEATTDKEGTFALALQKHDDERALAVEVHVVAEGWPTTVAKVPRGEPTDVRLQAGGTLRVLLSAAGRPVEGAKVRLARGPKPLPVEPRVAFPGFLERATASDGAADFLVPAGAYRLRVEADGLATHDTDVLEVASGKTTSQDVRLTEGIVVFVRALDRDGAPVAGAEVVVGGPFGTVRKGKTGDDGLCRLPGFAPPRPEADYWDRMVFWRVFSDRFAPFESSRTLPREASEVRLDSVLDRGGPARLRFQDGSGAAIADVRVTLVLDRNSANPLGDGWQMQLVSGADGRVVFPHLTPRLDRKPWTLNVSAPEGKGERWKRLYLEDASIGEDAPEQVVTMGSAAATLAGRVLRPDGTPATNGHVGWRPADALVPVSVARADLDAQGGFALKGLTPAGGMLVLGVHGYAPQYVPVAEGAFAANEPVTARLVEAPRIFGTVVTREGVAVPDATVKLWQQYAHPKEGWHTTQKVAETRTGTDGAFAFLGAADETYSIAVVSEGLAKGLPWPREVKRSDEPLRLAMKPASEGEGMPLVVRATAGGRTYSDKLSIHWKIDGRSYGAGEPAKDDEGRYVFRIWTDPGTYDLDFWAAGHRPFTVRGIRLEDRPGNPVVDVTLDRGAVLRLRVRDAEGEPVRNQWVSVLGQPVRTDDRGETEVGGFEPGKKKVNVELQADAPWTGASLEVDLPGTVDVALRRVGHVRVKIHRDMGAPRDVRLRLLAADGTLVDEEVVPSSRWPRSAEAYGTLEVTTEGAYRVEAVAGDRTRESSVHAAPGRAAEVTADFR